MLKTYCFHLLAKYGNGTQCCQRRTAQTLNRNLNTSLSVRNWRESLSYYLEIDKKKQGGFIAKSAASAMFTS